LDAKVQILTIRPPAAKTLSQLEGGVTTMGTFLRHRLHYKFLLAVENSNIFFVAITIFKRIES
jgi:hypothetical protein